MSFCPKKGNLRTHFVKFGYSAICLLKELSAAASSPGLGEDVFQRSATVTSAAPMASHGKADRECHYGMRGRWDARAKMPGKA